MKGNLEAVYKPGFFKNRYKLAWRVPIVCGAIVAEFQPESIIDVGCAIGDLVKGYLDLGLKSYGIEGSEGARSFMMIPAENFGFFDLRDDLPVEERYDLCTCFEVAEHVEPEYADIFARNLVSLSDSVLISAAPPGQGGHGHFNCQPIEYWDRKFEALGYKRNDSRTDSILKAFEPYKNKPGIKAYWHNLHYYEKG